MPENLNHRRILRMIGGMMIGLVIISGLTWSGALGAIVTWQAPELVSTALGGLLMMVALITGTGATNRKTYRALTDEGWAIRSNRRC